MPEAYREFLEGLYHRYNRREYVHPDPVEFLYRYEDLSDREIAAFVASSLAYGRVNQILKSVSLVLGRMESPSTLIRHATLPSLKRTFRDFKHRFTTGEELALMLFGIKGAVEKYGSLQECFARGLGEDDNSVLPALCAFVRTIHGPGIGQCNSLLPLPTMGSACKRLHLFLRWMVRRDEVDPGGWDRIAPSLLVVPVDTHMHRICLLMEMTQRKHVDMRTAMEITCAFRAIAPHDPVRYDFVLTRFGIRSDLNSSNLIKKFNDWKFSVHN